MDSYNIRVAFTDGTDILIQNVTEYQYSDVTECFQCIVAGYRYFFPKHSVKYFIKE